MDEIDVTALVGAVTRTVSTREHEGREAKAVTVRRRYPAPVADVWDALTNPERIPRWLLPVSGDLREGGRYDLDGNASGTITACEPPTRLAVTWEYGGDVSWVEVRLTPDGDATTFELEHLANVNDHWGEFGPGAVGVGWDIAVFALGRHLAGDDLQPAWEGTAPSLEFSRMASAAWGEAAITGGDDPEEARAAAARTAAAYAGDGTHPG